MKNSEALNAAADVIQSDGWHQGDYAPTTNVEDGTPISGLPVCTMGALHRAQGSTLRWSNSLGCWSDPTELFAADPIGTDALVDYLKVGNIPHWNDRPGRTAAEVIEVLRAAALVEAAKEDAALLAEAGRSA